MKGVSKVLIAVVIIAIIGISSGAYYWYTLPRQPPVIQEVVYGLQSDPTSLDPAIAPEATAWMVHYHIHETLIAWNVTSAGSIEYMPGLATSWRWLNETRLELTIRKNVKFHDGSILDAYAVKAGLERSRDAPYSTRKGNIDMVKYMSVVDNYTLVLGTDNPYSPLIAQLSLPYLAIVSPKRAEELGADYGQNPSGTGPFKFVERVTNEKIVLESFDDYWGVKPTLKRITYIPITDDASRIIALETGQIDIAANIRSVEVERLKSMGFVVPSVSGVRTGMLLLNCLKPPFNDKKVRQAVNYLIDREAICKTLFSGLATPAKSYLAPVYWGYNPSEMYTYDVEKGKQMLAEAGYADGFEVTLWTPQGKYMLDKEVCEAIGSYLDKANIKVNIEVYEWAVLYSKVTAEYNAVWVNKTKTAREYDMLYMALSSTTFDPDYLTDTCFSRPRIIFPDWINQTLGGLLAESRAAVDPDTRQAYFKQIQEIVIEDAPVIFSHVEPIIVVMKPSLHNVKNIAMEGSYFGEAYRR